LLLKPLLRRQASTSATNPGSWATPNCSCDTGCGARMSSGRPSICQDLTTRAGLPALGEKHWPSATMAGL
jgi:hypothetical protein